MQNEYHVAYWLDKDTSTGKSVKAVSMLEAIAKVQSSGIPLDQIIYAHAKDSVYKPKAIEASLPSSGYFGRIWLRKN